MEKKKAAVRARAASSEQRAEVTGNLSFPLLTAGCLLLTPRAWASASESYNPPWAGELGELGWASHELFARPLGAGAYLDNNSSDSCCAPWWQSNVAHPIASYGA